MPVQPILGTQSLEAALAERGDSVISLSPSELLATPAAQPLLAQVFPDEARVRFERIYGVDLRTVSRLVFTRRGNALSVLATVDSPQQALARVASAMAPIEVATPTRNVGRLGGRAWDISLHGDHLLALSIEGEAADIDSAFEFRRHLDDRVLVRSTEPTLFVHSRAPFDLGESALAIVLSDMNDFTLRSSASDLSVIEFELRGVFPESIEENLRTWLTNISRSSLGAILGLQLERLVIATVRGEGGIERVEGRLSLDLQQLAAGLYQIFSASIVDVLEQE